MSTYSAGRIGSGLDSLTIMQERRRIARLLRHLRWQARNIPGCRKPTLDFALQVKRQAGVVQW